MKKEVTTVDREGYWYRLINWPTSPPNIYEYRWGTATMEWIYRAHLEYLGRGKYVLKDTTCNGFPFSQYDKFSRKDRKKTEGYSTTIALIKRLMEK